MEGALAIRRLQRFGTVAMVSAALMMPGGSPAWAAQVFQESAGQVVIDAEHYHSKIPYSGQDWTLKTSQAGYAGSGYLEVLPDSGVTKNTGYVGASPELSYNVSFSTTGTYYVWTRGAGPNGNADTLHAGIDGSGPSSADRLSGFGTGWVWNRSTMDSVSATLSVTTPGLHTIHLWMREDGFRVDKFLLRKSTSSTAPSGTGPAESPKITVNTDTTPPTGSITMNSGAAATNNSTVTLALSATDDSGTVAQMQFSNDNVTYAAAETYAASRAWTLSSGEGAKTVYVKFQDAAGNWSSPASDTITLDTTPPQVAITSPADGTILTAPSP